MCSQVILVRHAKATYGGMRDRARPLAPHGVQQARRVADALATYHAPTQPIMVLSSPAVRAQMTAAIIAETAGAQLQEYEEIYSGDEDDLAALATRYLSYTTIIVGHSPVIPITASMLATPSDPDEISRRGCPTGTAYIFDVPAGVTAVTAGSLHLRDIVITPVFPRA
ncbi:MAG: phosphoglycerate mutase family protein [Actinomycetaceae bacterium]|nr:phosphoglycerate mutase family protein [Actinomycetaceae bacterium]